VPVFCPAAARPLPYGRSIFGCHPARGQAHGNGYGDDALAAFGHTRSLAGQAAAATRLWLLFVALAWLFGPCQVHYRIRRVHRRMPLLLGFVLVAAFIWLAENAGTLGRAWLYPAQRHGWHMVPLGKLGAWLLLMVISYVMVSALHRRAAVARAGADRWPQAPGSATLSG
jgi:hypothetical protein